MGTAFLRWEGATKVWPAAQHQFPIYICHRGVHSKRELALYFATNPGYQKWMQAQSTLVIWGQMLKERNRGRMLLKIRMSHAVHLTRSKVQTGAENKTEDSDRSTGNRRQPGGLVFWQELSSIRMDDCGILWPFSEASSFFPPILSQGKEGAREKEKGGLCEA